jgi:hypothetical protein
MKSNRAFLFTLIIFGIHFSSAAFCAPGDAIKEYLRQRTGVLTRDVVVFHYEQTSDNSPRSYLWGLEHLKQQIDTFYDPNNLSDNGSSGPSLYTAIDPAAYRFWGGNNFKLFVIQVKKGTRFLDLKNEKLGEFNALKSDAESMGCKIDNDYSQVIRLRVNPNIKCRQSMIAMIKDLDIGFITESDSASNSIENCDRSNNIYTINIIKLRAMDLFHVRVFNSTDKFHSDDQLMKNVDFLYQEAIRDPHFEFRKQYGPKLWDNSETPDQSYHQWLSEHIAA